MSVPYDSTCLQATGQFKHAQDLPTPLFWSISRSFFMLSSRAWSVCFWVSIL